jgi:hypothetical protein
MGSNIQIFERALTKEECEELIGVLVDVNYDAPTLDYNSLKRTKVTEHKIVKKLSTKYDLKYDRAFVMWYPNGVGSPLHIDNYSVEDKQEVFHCWKSSAVLFLNENFDGGELIYPDQGVTIKPKIGNMVIAPADDKSPHYVNAPSSDRFVLVLRLI